MDLHQWPTISFIRRHEILLLIERQKLRFLRIKNWLINYSNPSLKILKNVRYTHSSPDNICGADVRDMLISKCNKEVRFLLHVVDIYRKYAWLVLLEDKKDNSITKAFQKNLDESSHKPSKTWTITRHRPG